MQPSPLKTRFLRNRVLNTPFEILSARRGGWVTHRQRECRVSSFSAERSLEYRDGGAEVRRETSREARQTRCCKGPNIADDEWGPRPMVQSVEKGCSAGDQDAPVWRRQGVVHSISVRDDHRRMLGRPRRWPAQTDVACRAALPTQCLSATRSLLCSLVTLAYALDPPPSVVGSR